MPAFLFLESPMKTPVTKRQTVPIGSIVGNPKNDRVHTQDQIDLLVRSIQKFGQPRPILVRQANRMMIAGHGVCEAMKQAGRTEIDVLFWDVDQKTADAYLVADNRFGELSYSDLDRRRALLAELEGEDYGAIGFLPDEVENILSAEQEEIEVQEIETGQVEDKFWLTCQGPLADQAVVLHRLRELMREFPEVIVELGTMV
jgi:ParB-like chromosome segregation protein Spo0J